MSIEGATISSESSVTAGFGWPEEFALPASEMESLEKMLVIVSFARPSKKVHT
ncbi:MAG: hypothetical protein STSR0001_00240 [Methanothrix sp.]